MFKFMTCQNFKDSLREGIYHEIGHVIGTWLCFPHEERLRGICLKMNPNGSYGLCVEYIEDIKFDYRTQLDAFTCSSLAGGVFQQMKNVQLSLNKGQLKYSLIETLVNHFNKDRAFLMFIYRNVNPYDKGMDKDNSTLKNIYDKLREENYIKHRLDINKSTKNCISLLLPFINRPEIDSLCEYCLNEFWKGGQCGVPQIEVDTKTIKVFIGCLF